MADFFVVTVSCEVFVGFFLVFLVLGGYFFLGYSRG